MTEDHAWREDERGTAERVVFDGLHACIVDGPVRADLGRRDDTEVDRTAVQRPEVAFRESFCLLWLLLPLLAPDLRPRPPLQRCTSTAQQHFELEAGAALP